jgi:hypothetical protein
MRGAGVPRSYVAADWGLAAPQAVTLGELLLFPSTPVSDSNLEVKKPDPSKRRGLRASYLR